jgi:hypothetical protein
MCIQGIYLILLIDKSIILEYLFEKDISLTLILIILSNESCSVYQIWTAGSSTT